MSSARHNLSVYQEANMPSAEGMHFGIVVAEWNADITHALYEGCHETLIKHGAKPEHIYTAQVPGSFELTVGARMMLQHRHVDAVICLGCVIKGETSHNEYINHSVAMGLTNLGLTSGKPCIFGVLTPNNEEQALDRAGGIHGNKGVEAAATAIRMAALARSLARDKAPIGFDLKP